MNWLGGHPAASRWGDAASAWTAVRKASPRTSKSGNWSNEAQAREGRRWQFLGGMPEDDRRAFLFTNVIDSKGRKYDMPVVVGALASSPAIYALGMGRPVEEIGEAWMEAIAHPIPPVLTNNAPCQEVVITGDTLRTEGVKFLPVPVSTPGFDAAPYLTATLCVTRDPDSKVQNFGMYRVGLKAPDRMAARMVASSTAHVTMRPGQVVGAVEICSINTATATAATPGTPAITRRKPSAIRGRERAIGAGAWQPSPPVGAAAPVGSGGCGAASPSRGT